MKKALLTIAMIVGFVMMVSEGSVCFWANFVGIALFGGCGWKLGAFKQHKYY